jgi:hypothetical protein
MQIYVRVSVLTDDGLPILGAEEGEVIVTSADAYVNADRAQQQLGEAVERVQTRMRRQFRAFHESIAAAAAEPD